MVEVRIGTSGWSYDHWDGVLYPQGMDPRDRLAAYCAEFDTVELNASYYRWPRTTSFASWRRRLPPGFLMTVKAPRGLTHARRLYRPEPWLDRLVAGFHALGDKRGTLLVQLPPSLERDDARLDWFLGMLPPWITPAVEFRHPSWHCEEVFALLERRGAAYVVTSGAGLPCVLRATHPLVYLRLHGPDEHWLYGGRYGEQSMGWWADRIREWTWQGHSVHAYFNNDGGGNAVHDARELKRQLGM